MDSGCALSSFGCGSAVTLSLGVVSPAGSSAAGVVGTDVLGESGVSMADVSALSIGAVSIEGRWSVELRALPWSTEPRGEAADVEAGGEAEGAFLAARAFASRACSRSLARLLEEERELTVRRRKVVSCGQVVSSQSSVSISPGVVALAAAAAAGPAACIGLAGPGCAAAAASSCCCCCCCCICCFCWACACSPSAKMLSRRDSTPATAWERKEPHLDDDGFAGAAMMGVAALLSSSLVLGCALATWWWLRMPLGVGLVGGEVEVL